MANDWRNRIYDNYMSNVFADAHKQKNDMKLQCKYFKKTIYDSCQKMLQQKFWNLEAGWGIFIAFC